MTMCRTALMGDPRHFSVQGGGSVKRMIGDLGEIGTPVPGNA